MAIVKMRKLNLVAMSYEKDAVLNALQKTGAVEVTLHAGLEDTEIPIAETEGLKSEFLSVETALQTLHAEVESWLKDSGEKSDVLKDGFDVTYSEFMSIQDEKEKVLQTVQEIRALADEKNALIGEQTKLRRQKEQASIYAELVSPFIEFGDTSHTKGRLGTVSVQQREGLMKALAEIELSAVEVLKEDTENVLLFVAAHKSVATEVNGILSAFSFTECPYSGNTTGEKIYAELMAREKEIQTQLNENRHTMYAFSDKIRLLKVYCDYLSFLLEKEETSEKLRATDYTFLLQAYLPEMAEEAVKEALQSVSGAMFMEFSDPTDEDEPPTLLENNGIVSNFESITNTYSTPHYREFDPNAVMAFFYSLFMGFIIGDAGYGLLMALIGGYLWKKNRARPTGMSRLAGAFAVGGVFAIFWGALFNSFFGIALLPKTLMPNPQTDMWSLAGISVPSVLIISMVMGVGQLCVGYICKAVQEWRRKNIIDGICDGVLWAIFSVGVALAIVGFVDEAQMPILGTVGGIMAGVTLLLAVLTAGRKEKFFGKFTKGFGAAYGVINYASDILSYARLYGLMLSGAVIAQIIATYSGQFITSGNIPMIILGLVILIIGHAFNLVMNLLGAYIHDARLQYVEFYGRFYEGDGELFRPLGSSRKYIYLLPERNK